MMNKTACNFFNHLVPVLIIALFIGCDSGTILPSEDDNNPAPTTNISSPLETFYPHTAGWKDPAQHGETARNNSVELCRICHDLSDKAPKCTSCHQDYPHQKDWVQPSRHGATVMAKGTEGCATLCHGYDLKGGLTGISCNLCHSTFPHPQDWKEAINHGVTFKTGGKTNCTGCHGGDLMGGSAKVNCTQCHSPYPHPSGWKEGGNHGKFILNNGITGCTTSCHGTDLKGGLSGVSCATCHAAYPHPAEWKDKLHGKAALQNGSTSCKTCHAADGAGLKAQPCQTCHADYPHPEKSIWSGFKGGHGEAIVKTYGGKTDKCQSCHGSDLLKIMPDQKNCMSCHPSYPHKQDKGWKSADGHGTYAIQKTTTECRLCHGNDLKGGLRNNPSCSSCHASYPHPPGWTTGAGHGKTFSSQYTANSANADCWSCHDKPLPFNNAQKKAEIQKQSFCQSCHFAYPHTSYTDDVQGNEPMGWEPVVKPGLCGSVKGWEKMANIGHIYYLIDNPLLSDAQGNHPSFSNNPPTPANSPLWPAAVSNTCGGGTAGNCHFDGHRSYNINQKAGLCGSVCHTANQPLPPPLPPCPPAPPGPPVDPPPCPPEEGEC